MVPVNLKSLVSKFNDVCRKTLEDAAGLCLQRTNYNVEIEHWLLKLLEVPGSDLSALFRYYEVDVSRLQRDLTKVVDKFKSGNARAPALSPNIVDLGREAWVIASLEYQAPKTRTGHLLLALLSDDRLQRVAADASQEFAKITPEALKKDFRDIVANSTEAELEQQAVAQQSSSGDGPNPVRPGSKTPSLDQFTIDLTGRAKAGKIDPVLGRDPEIRQVIDILTRRRQNNPIMTGEAGVGKTAVVEGFALRIAAGDVPPQLRNVSLRTLDLGLLQAGAGMKGEFENRLKSVIEEVKASPTPIIIFIDEAHTMIGAGGQAGQGDAANLLKPALARGELRTIAATTWAEYKKYFERDAALARRFQVVKVEEPIESIAIEMMRGLVETLEKHHKIKILNEAVIDAVRLSNRYISGRQLPDKSVSLLDTACARVAIGFTAVPAAVEDCRRRIEQLGVQIGILERENVAVADHAEKLGKAIKEKTESEAELITLEKRWQDELKLVTEIRNLIEKLEGTTEAGAKKAAAAAATAAKVPGAPPAPPPAAPLSPEERTKTKAELDKKSDELKALQGENPLIHVCVDSQAIADVVANWTGIPVGRMVSNEIQTVLNLKTEMEKYIVGQSHALEAIAEAVRTSRAGMTDPRKPIGVFMLVGPSGVGKTETAITLANLLYGGDQNMTVINMSEYKEEHKVSLLMGSPPGYIGFGEGGVLTEAVRRRPYSVVLLDELEKAHPGVQEIFYQVFDKGILRDGEGRDIDFKNTILLMTSNAGTDTIMKLCADPDTMPDAKGLAEAMHPELLKTFKPAFLGRMVIVPYFPLSEDVLKGITELKLGKIKKRVQDTYQATFTYGPELVDAIVSRCKEVASGARNVDNIISRTVLPELSSEFLAKMAEGKQIKGVNLTVAEDGEFKYDISTN